MPEFEYQTIKDVVESSDVNKDRRINDVEKEAIKENIKIAEKLYRFSAGNEQQKKALDEAIDSVAEEYEGLSSDEIKEWIAEELQVPTPEFDESSRRLGKPPRRTKAHRAWERLDIQQKKEALMASREIVKVKPPQTRRLKQLQLIVAALQASKKMYGKGKNIIQKGMIGLFLDVKKISKYTFWVNDFIRDTVPKIANLIARKPKATLKQILKEVGQSKLYSAFAQKGIHLDECSNDEQVVSQHVALVKELRKLGDYQSARYICEDLLSSELDDVFKGDKAIGKMMVINVPSGDRTVKEKVYWDLYSEAQDDIRGKMNVDKVANELKEKAPHLTKQVALKKAYQYMNKLIYQSYLHKKHKKLLDMVHKKDIHKKWSPAKQKLWAEYKDNMGIGKLDLADESWDMILDELLVNAPLIILSGGIASGARFVATKAISAGARVVLGAARVGSVVVRTGRVGRLAGAAAGLAVEGLAFEVANAGLRGEWLFKSPGWAKRVMWTTVTLGLFKKAGKFGDKLIGKKGALSGIVGKIASPYVKKGVEELIIKGHLEIAIMMIMGAVQNPGGYTGSFDEIIEHFGEELFHSYVSVGSLKLSGKGVQVAGKLLPFKAPSLADTAVESAQQQGAKLFKRKRVKRPSFSKRFREQAATRKLLRKRRKVKPPEVKKEPIQAPAEVKPASKPTRPVEVKPAAKGRPEGRAETQRTILDLPKDVKSELGKLLRAKSKVVLADLNLLLSKVDNPKGLRQILIKKLKLSEAEAKQVADILIKNKDKIVEKKAPTKKPGVETQERTILDLPKDVKSELGKLLRAKSKDVLADLNLLLSKVDNPRALRDILIKKLKLSEAEARQVADILIKNKDKIVEKKVLTEKPKAKEGPEIFQAKQFDSLLQENGMTFDTLVKGESKESLRRDQTVDCLDVNSDRFDHHQRRGEDVSATDLVVQQRAKILESRDRIKKVVSHKSADADSIASTSLYLLIRTGKITGVEPAVRRLVRHVNAADLGKWKKMSFDNADLSFLISRIKDKFPGEDAMHYRVGFEIIRRIITRNLDPANLKPSDFSDIVLRKGKKKTVSLGELIKDHSKKRKENIDKFKEVEVAGAFDLPGGGKGIRLDGIKSIDNMEIYARGYDVIFTGESVFFKPEFATKKRTLELHRRLEVEESRIRREMAEKDPATYNNPEFLRAETVRPGYEGRSAETGGNSNPWHHEADYSYIVQPGKSKWGKSQIPQARIAEIIMSTLQTTK